MTVRRFGMDEYGCWEPKPDGLWVQTYDVVKLEEKLKQVETERDDAVRLAMGRVKAETYFEMEAEIEALKAQVARLQNEKS